MSAVNFTIDHNLVGSLAKESGAKIFIETGTFHGDTIDIVKNYFDNIYSIELSRNLYQMALNRFSGESRIHLFEGDSSELLEKVLGDIKDEAVIFWLDAHWCIADETAGEKSQCPLIAELRAIQSLGEGSVVLIDDARLFMASPPRPHEVTDWPKLQDILDELKQLNSSHRLSIVNDVIIYYPPALSNCIESYSREFGFDWLAAAHSHRLMGGLRKDWEDRLTTINILDADLKKSLEAIRIKDMEIERLKGLCGDYGLIGLIKRYLKL